jgi:hypothetical protein
MKIRIKDKWILVWCCLMIMLGIFYLTTTMPGAVLIREIEIKSQKSVSGYDLYKEREINNLYDSHYSMLSLPAYFCSSFMPPIIFSAVMILSLIFILTRNRVFLKIRLPIAACLGFLTALILFYGPHISKLTDALE